MKNIFPFFSLALLLAACSKSDQIKKQEPPDPETTAVFNALSPASGKSGDIITLSGTGFHAAAAENEVLFSGTITTASIKAATDTSLVVEVPSGATTGVITVKVMSVAASLASGFNGIFTIKDPNTTGDGTLILRDNLKTHLDFGADDHQGNYFTLNPKGPSHPHYKVIRIDANGNVSKTFEPADFGATTTTLSINGITSDHQGNIWVAVAFSAFRYSKSEGRLYKIEKNSDHPVFVMDIIGMDLEEMGTDDYFRDMVINSKNELLFSDGNRLYKVPATGIIEVYMDDKTDLNAATYLTFQGLAIDGNDNLYFTAVNGANSVNNIYKVTPAKSITQLYTSTTFGFNDGPLAGSKFNVLGYIAVNKEGNQLYIADGGGYRLRKLDLSTNQVTTLAGTGKATTVVNKDGKITVDAYGPALESTTQPVKLSLCEEQKTIYLQNPNDNYYQLYKY